MRLRELLKKKDYAGREADFILGRFVLVGSFSGKTRYDSSRNLKKMLDKYLDDEVTMLSSEIRVDDGFLAKPNVVIYVEDYDITQKELKAKPEKHKENPK